MRKVLENRCRRVIYSHSLRRARFAKYRFSNLHTLHFRCFIPCLGSKSLLHGVVYTKSVTELEEISYIYSQSSQNTEFAYSHSLRRARFAKYRFSNLHIPRFRCFIPCLGYGMEESDCCDTGYIHFSTFLFVSFRFVLFRFAKYSKPFRSVRTQPSGRLVPNKFAKPRCSACMRKVYV